MDSRPGLNHARLVQLMRAAVERCRLDLRERVVLTEAATGAYVVTPVLAAMAGARVFALAGDTAYGTADDIVGVTSRLAGLAGVTEAIEYVDAKSPRIVALADIVTNSGQVRPIDSEMLAAMRSSAVVPLMYEAWEYRAADLDLEACRARGIRVAGTNERHSAVDVFSFLGVMAVKQLHDAGISVYGSNIVLLCGNDFGPFIDRGLRAAGADVLHVRGLDDAIWARYHDAVLVAQNPARGCALGAVDADMLARNAPGTVVVEYWGESDRRALADRQVPVWPPAAAPAGHMAVLPSAVGPEPIVRLQAGGLKVGEVLSRGIDRASPEELAFVQLL